MLSIHNSGYNELFSTMHSSTDITPSGMSSPMLARVKYDPVELVTLLSHDEEHINMCLDGESLPYHTVEGLLIDSSVLGLAYRILTWEFHLACNDVEPRSFVEAEKHAAWHAAMQSGMDAVETNRT
jgi:hypothetical protein